MGFIYKIENLSNKKIYIGQTRRSVERRWYEHINYAQNHLLAKGLHGAINKYGAEQFLCSTLEECQDSQLNEREIYYIKFYQSYITEKGYNLTYGGDNGTKLNYDDIYYLWSNGKSCNQIAKQLSSSTATISEIIKKKYPDSEEEIRIRGYQDNTISRSKPILQYNEEGEEVGHFSSIAEASRKYGSNISRAIETQTKAHGFYWCLEEAPFNIKEIVSKSRFSKKFKPVLQFDLHENFLIEYASLKEASEKTGISHIGDVCNGKRKSAGGFLWRWKND